MKVEDENDIVVEMSEDRPVVPAQNERERYWEVVRRSVREVFRGDESEVKRRKARVDKATRETQEKFYQGEPYSVAADIAGEIGPGTPRQQIEYLKIKRELGYGEEPEVPPHLWAATEALSRG